MSTRTLARDTDALPGDNGNARHAQRAFAAAQSEPARAGVQDGASCVRRGVQPTTSALHGPSAHSLHTPQSETGHTVTRVSLGAAAAAEAAAMRRVSDTASCSQWREADLGTSAQIAPVHDNPSSAASTTSTTTATTTLSRGSFQPQHRTGVDAASVQTTSCSTSTSTAASSHREESAASLTAAGAAAGTDVPETENDAFDEHERVILAISWRSGMLGAAYYDTNTMQLHVISDVRDANDLSVLEMVFMQVSPDVVVISTNQDEDVVVRLRGLMATGVAGEGKPACTLEKLPAGDFAPDLCKRRLIHAHCAMVPPYLRDEEREVFIQSAVPFENVQMIRAAGALVRFIELHRVGVELEDAHVRVPITTIEMTCLDRMMAMDDNALSSLQIFQKESHPVTGKLGKNGGKEGLSLFGLANRTRTSLGSAKLRPLADLSEIRERHRTIAFLLNPEHADTLKVLTDCVRQIKNMVRIIGFMQRSHASPSDWKVLFKSMYHAVQLQTALKALNSDLRIFSEFASCFGPDIPETIALINKIIDFDQSIVQQRFVVKAAIDNTLDEMKRMYQGLPDLMTNVALAEMDDNAEIDECNVVYFPQIGYLVAVPRRPTMRMEKDFAITGFDFQFVTQHSIHYKSPRTREMDQELGDIHGDIIDRETDIMYGLQKEVLKRTRSVAKIMDLVATLDWQVATFSHGAALGLLNTSLIAVTNSFLALASFAREYNYTQPVMMEENVLDITGGRHPLQELCVDTFIPNDTDLSVQSGPVHIVTGPNASGKSIYLKQIAMIQFLAQVGSFVPAERAVLGCVDRIFTRIHTRESVSVARSTFMIDLNQVVLALRFATARSLVVIDEFGKGTSAADGLALLSAVVSELVSRGAACPKTVISTHFHKLCMPGLLPPAAISAGLLKFFCLEVLETVAPRDALVSPRNVNSEHTNTIDADADVARKRACLGGGNQHSTLHGNTNDLVFLYRVVSGTAQSSFGCRIAGLAGVPLAVVARGMQVTDLHARGDRVHRLGETESDVTRRAAHREIVSCFLQCDLAGGESLSALLGDVARLAL
ncbi:MSH5 protein, variant [Capsaspora owczarzaki ATCC 30864]|uniref:MSH5 protein, variant n=1 Tax=Capsaspora owczarzaki (strain ATCC 30864) TaxID=595528 RepID=UPI0001FE68EC|nr:MSH5 protein, variant [Capsaspora owczarzaki ATCC 30864]|eukprot:XP_011270058.1 MSH5 protein, variant [Capsaspora owczarzaki ATCC 30864]